MNTSIPIKQFDLSRFVEAVVSLWGGDHEVAFPLVENGFADFGTDCLGDEADEAGQHPLDWLQHGHVLFGQFSRRCGDRYDLADGTTIDPGDDARFDECSCCGFLVSLMDGKLAIQTAILTDVSGECRVYAVEEAGVFEPRMRRFVETMRLRAS